MLYVSTRNATDTYTAYRALHEANAPDGGFYLPFHQPEFTQEELAAIKARSVGETLAQILNLFFGLRLTGWDVDYAVGRNPIKAEILSQRLVTGELWRNPGGSADYLLASLYRLITGNKDMHSVPIGWVRIAIEISLLFGLYSAFEDDSGEAFDIAVSAGDFSQIVAAVYAKNMGLPIGTLLCACDEKGMIWDFLSKGELHTGACNMPEYLECYLAIKLGQAEALRYLDAQSKNAVYRIDEVQLESVCSNIFPAVVSTGRIDAIVSGMYRANNYAIDCHAALAYGALQDYRAKTGISKVTLITARRHPGQMKE